MIAAALLFAFAWQSEIRAADETVSDGSHRPAEFWIFQQPHFSEWFERSQSIIYDFIYGDATSRPPELDNAGLDLWNGAAINSVQLNVSKSASSDAVDAHMLFYHGSDLVFEFPEFEKISTNPVIFGFLEHDVQEMSRLTGGGDLYFRNRISQSLASARAELGVIKYANGDVPARVIEFQPYFEDVGNDLFEFHDELREKIYQIWLSEDVPGYVAKIMTFVKPAPEPEFGLEKSLIEKSVAPEYVTPMTDDAN